MAGGFQDKVVFITGASAGIGEAMAREFAARGAAVALAARRVERLQALRDELVGHGARAVAVACDVTADGSVEEAVATAREALGPIDVVVANAGFGVGGRVDRLSVDDFRRQFETNVFGVLRTVYAALPDLKQRRGRIVLIGSVSGYVSTPATAPYAMSKFAVRALGDALWAELARDGVAVTTIHPGYVASEIRRVDNRGTLRADARDPVPAWLQMPAATAARQIVDAVARRRRERVVTGHGKLIVCLSRLVPCLLAHVLKRGASKGRKMGGVGAKQG
ncbi:MAG TPA: SDR family NAD(P)-dependent oxidoreductase [Myxococcota bacterium]|mgnify:CR=1 FL=1|nr:SDR family NAD(P)-dependent oxidoreductase [Myxococcota bacterium]